MLLGKDDTDAEHWEKLQIAALAPAVTVVDVVDGSLHIKRRAALVAAQLAPKDLAARCRRLECRGARRLLLLLLLLGLLLLGLLQNCLGLHVLLADAAMREQHRAAASAAASRRRDEGGSPCAWLCCTANRRWLMPCRIL